MKTWNMQTQLAQGRLAEADFIERCHLDLVQVPGKGLWDFDSSCGLKVELKSDTYPMEKTANFFMERWSVIEQDKPGGPWQSLEKGADTFIYLFANSNTYFQFLDLPALVDRLDVLTKDSDLVRIKNVRWTTGGFKVRRDDLKDLYQIFEWED